MKILKNLVLAGLLSTGVYAEDMYIGVGVMTGSGTQTLKYNGTTYTADYDTSATSIKFGYITEDNNRMEFAINKFDLEGTKGGTDTYTGWDFNYLWSFLDGNLHPYLGLGIGMYTSDKMEGETESGDTENATALALVGSIGLVYSINKSVEIETGYKFHSLAWNYADVDLTDDFSNLYVGANFKF